MFGSLVPGDLAAALTRVGTPEPGKALAAYPRGRSILAAAKTKNYGFVHLEKLGVQVRELMQQPLSAEVLAQIEKSVAQFGARASSFISEESR